MISSAASVFTPSPPSTIISFAVNQHSPGVVGRRANGTAATPQVDFTVEDRWGKLHNVRANVGTSVWEAVRNAGIEIEGACEGSLACGMCHVHIDKEHAKKFPPPVQQEKDTLMFAPNRSATSRLSCALLINHDSSSMLVKIPNSS
ncbi:ferredoxin, mitochondrial [Pelomyxa schiedti]|nr:ferredoxin, mitochondrial [Pelomyxa schiedti]